MLERLQFILNVVPGRDAVRLLEHILPAGPMLVQLRAKTLIDRELYDLAVTIVGKCHDKGSRCIIDDRVDIALAANADGVHVGDCDLPVAQARNLLGPERIVGATARNVAAAHTAQCDGATYIGCGPVFPTTTKAGLPDALGIAHVASVASAIDIPVFAIGGVSVEAVEQLRANGCHGVAVVGAISDALDPCAEATRFVHAVGTTTVPA
jgi:thiamine-phosphate pyrophosphorylase